MTEKSHNYCLNCKKHFVDDSKFCFACGQSKRASILSIGELWTNFWTTIFNVDNSFFTTLRLIARPDKLTALYVSGRRKQHINPVRLFLISLVFFVAAVIGTMGDFGDNTFLSNMNRDYYNSLLLEKFEETVDGEMLDIGDYSMVQGLKGKIFEGVSCSDVDTIFDGMTIIDAGAIISLTKTDFVELSEEEIYEKYNADSFWEKLNYRQYIRINKDPNASNKYLFNNALWGLIPCILVLSFFLKLLYHQHKISYLEHLILVVNTHSFLFLFWMSVSIFVRFFIQDKSKLDWVFPIGLLLSIIYVFIIMYIYYREHFFRSFLKFISALLIYTFFGFVFIVLSIVISGFIL